jgi:hypothetical protein
MANLNLLQEKIENLTESEIKKCYDEIIGYRKIGTLPEDALVRQIRNQYANEIKNDNWDMNCYFTAQDIIFEIAKRHYNREDD